MNANISVQLHAFLIAPVALKNIMDAILAHTCACIIVRHQVHRLSIQLESVHHAQHLLRPNVATAMPTVIHLARIHVILSAHHHALALVIQDALTDVILDVKILVLILVQAAV